MVTLYMNYPEWLSPVIIPGLPLRWYGLMYLVAFGLTYVLFTYQVRRRKLQVDDETVINMFFWAIIGLLIGARVFATTVYDPTGYYLRRPWLIFWPFDENMNFTGLLGMSYHGGLVGAVVGVVAYLRIKKIDILDWGDMLVTAIPLGYTFGRLGNFINGELYGRVTAGPWGMLFPNARRIPATEPWAVEIAEQVGITVTAPEQLLNLPRHPSQLYEAFLEGILLWLVLWFVLSPRKPFRGFMIGAYLIGYGLVRFIAEYTRQPDADLGFPIQLSSQPNPPELFVSLLNISMGQILSLLMVVAGAVCLLVFHRIRQKEPKVETHERVLPPEAKGKRRAQGRKAGKSRR